jgi:hypothetical protein
MPPPSGICHHCGARPTALTGLGPILTISDGNPFALRSLITGEIWNVSCEHCKRPISVTPTILLVSEDPRAVGMVVGSRAAGYDEELKAPLGEILPSLYRGIKPNVFGAREELQNWLIARLCQQAPLINQLLAALREKETSAHFITTHWRVLSPAIFAGVVLGITGAIPGHRIAADVNTSPEKIISEVLRRIGTAQALLWIVVALKAPEEASQSRNFEELICRYVDQGFVLKEAFDAFLTVIGGTLEQYNEDPLSQYALLAVEASVVLLHKHDNPREGRWAASWLAIEIAAASRADQTPHGFELLLISAARARATIGVPALWDAFIPLLKNPSLSFADHIDAIVKKIGRQDEIADLLVHGRQLTGLDNSPLDHGATDLKPEHQLARIREIIRLGASYEGLLLTAYPYARALLQRNRIDELVEFADGLRDLCPDDVSWHARVESFLGRHLKMAGQFQRYLDRIGDIPSDWERGLEITDRLQLWTERGNALRGVGRAQDSLALNEEIARLAFSTKDFPIADRRVAMRNLAIALRETGAPDKAITILEPLLVESCDTERIDVLKSLVTTYMKVGRTAEAIVAAEAARGYATGPFASRAAELAVVQASLLMCIGRFEEGAAILAELPPPEHPWLAVTEASGWANYLANIPSVRWPRSVIARLPGVLERISSASSIGNSRNEIPLVLAACQVGAELAEVMNPSDAERYWIAALETFNQLDQQPHANILTALARHAYLRKEFNTARAYLEEVPAAFAREYGGAGDLAAVLDASGPLETHLRRLSEIALEGGLPWEDVRRIAELHRDGFGRARRLWATAEPQQPQILLSNETIQSLRPSAGAVAVVEWLSDSRMIVGFVTRIPNTGDVRSHFLASLPPLDWLPTLRQRLQTWNRRWPGDPFDMEEWSGILKWVNEELGQHLGPDDHVVFIEPAEFQGIPWHVAVSGRWTCSYASGWSNLISLHKMGPPGLIQSLGGVCVARPKDTVVGPALTDAASQARRIAAARGLTCEIAEGPSTDREALFEVLNRSDAALLLCHGLIDSVANEVALVLCHDGLWPPADYVVTGNTGGRQHLVSWRDCQHLSRTSSLVVTAACSSGACHIAGLGDRLGLYAALANSGTRSLIGPRWDIPATQVLPVVLRTVELRLSGSASVASALREACLAAERQLPRWLAWSLALEGDWR